MTPPKQLTHNEAAYDMVTSFYNRLSELTPMCDSYAKSLEDKHANTRCLLNKYLNQIEDWMDELRIMQAVMQDYRWR